MAASDASLTAHILLYKWSQTPNLELSTIFPFYNKHNFTLISIPEGSFVFADLSFPKTSLTFNPK